MTKWLQTRDESNRIIRKWFVWWIAQITQSLFTDLAVFMRMLSWSADAGDLVMPLYCVHLLITLINLPTLSSDQDKNNRHDSFANNASSYCHNKYSNSQHSWLVFAQNSLAAWLWPQLSSLILRSMTRIIIGTSWFHRTWEYFRMARLIALGRGLFLRVSPLDELPFQM